jgi:hypothetical protein
MQYELPTNVITGNCFVLLEVKRDWCHKRNSHIDKVGHNWEEVQRRHRNTSETVGNVMTSLRFSY